MVFNEYSHTYYALSFCRLKIMLGWSKYFWAWLHLFGHWSKSKIQKSIFVRLKVICQTVQIILNFIFVCHGFDPLIFGLGRHRITRMRKYFLLYTY